MTATPHPATDSPIPTVFSTHVTVAIGPPVEPSFVRAFESIPDHPSQTRDELWITFVEMLLEDYQQLQGEAPSQLDCWLSGALGQPVVCMGVELERSFVKGAWRPTVRLAAEHVLGADGRPVPGLLEDPVRACMIASTFGLACGANWVLASGEPGTEPALLDIELVDVEV